MGFVEVLFIKAEKLIEQGSLQAARSILADLAHQQPERPEIRGALGKVCGYLQDHLVAIQHLEAACRLSAGSLELAFTLGYEYCQVGRFPEAVSCFDQLVDKLPQLPALHRWRGHALAQMGRHVEAWKAFDAALKLKPDYAEALSSMANILQTERRVDEAEVYLLRAIELAPDFSGAHNDLGRVYRLQGRMQEALSCYRRALELEPQNLAAVSNCLYAQCYLDNVSPEELAAEHFRLARRLRQNTLVDVTSAVIPKKAGEKIRIGYVSGDFWTHSVAYFLEPILLHHDRQRFEIHCYSNKVFEDDTTRRLRALADNWRVIVGVQAEAVAAWVAEDGIDVLIDLSGHSAGHRLDVFMLRPAAVQCSWIGYPHSTGLEQIDYYVTDAWCDPPGLTEQLYSEKLVRLPRVFSCYLPPLNFPAVSPAPCSTGQPVTFGSFNNLPKVNHKLVALWAAILTVTPGSRLYLKSGSLAGDQTRGRLLEQFAEHGIDPERIELQPFAHDTVAHLGQYAEIDIALDTFPYHGTTTTCEALFMGVPVVTLAGTHHLSRVGVSFLHAVGLADLIAETPDDYVRIASTLAADKQRLTHLRESLRTLLACSALMDGPGVTRDFEDACEQMLKGVSR